MDTYVQAADAWQNFGLLTSHQAMASLLRWRRQQRLTPEHREFLLNKRDAPLEALRLPVLNQFCASAALPPIADYRRALGGAWLPGKPPEKLPIPGQPLPWHERRAVAIFRGSATGAGVTSADNMRLRLCALSAQWAHGLLDAKLTSWNARHKNVDGVVRVIDPDSAAPPLSRSSASASNRLPMAEQAKYKFAVLVDGNVGAARLGELAHYEFLVLWVASTLPQVCYAEQLLPWRHYVPVATDLCDLEAQLHWCQEHDGEAKAMAEAMRELLVPQMSRRALESATRQVVAALPGPLQNNSFCQSVWYAWHTHRNAIYVLIDPQGEILAFQPFANADYRNDGLLRFEQGSPTRFLAHAQRLWPRAPSALADHRRWWANGGLVCNVQATPIWGDSMLSEFYLLLSARP